MMQASTTIFTVREVAASLAYYRDRLGFDVAFEHGNPLSYAGLCSGDVTLHLIAASRAPRPPGHGAVAIDVADVDALHRELTRRGANVRDAPSDQDYGLRTFAVADPDGNVLFFSMEIPMKRGL